MGYRLDLQNRKIIETGVISIDIRPKNASVYLNDVKINKSIPIRLTNRTPGTYSLKISLPGYKTWEKNIDVKSRQTTYIKNITLLKDSLPMAVDSSRNNIEYILPSTDGRFILVSEKDGDIRNIELFDTQTEKFSNIFRLLADSKYQLEWSPFNNFISFIEYKGNTASVNILSATNADIIKNFELPTKNNESLPYQWQKSTANPILFVEQNNKISKLTMSGSENIFDSIPSKIWYIDDLERLWILDQNKLKINGSENEQDSIAVSNILETEKIVDINNDRAILKDNNGTTVISRNENKQETIGTSYFRRNIYTNEWLTWSAWELWSIYEHDKPALLNRTSDNIKSVFPLDDVGVLVIANNNGIESFNPGYYVSQNLYSGDVSSASVNRKISKIYFLGKVGEKTGLYELEY